MQIYSLADGVFCKALASALATNTYVSAINLYQCSVADLNPYSIIYLAIASSLRTFLSFVIGIEMETGSVLETPRPFSKKIMLGLRQVAFLENTNLGGLKHLTTEGRNPEAVRCIRPPKLLFSKKAAWRSLIAWMFFSVQYFWKVPLTFVNKAPFSESFTQE